MFGHVLSTRLFKLALIGLVSLGIVRDLGAATIAEAQRLYRTGEYARCLETAAKAIESGDWEEGWWLLKIRAELTTGRYAEALKSYEQGLDRHDDSVPLRLLGYEVLRLNDRPGDAEQLLVRIREVAGRAPWRYSDPQSRVELGRALLLSGADARQVLELFFDRAKRGDPESAEPYVASGELALEKHDYAVAAESYQEGAKRRPDDPDIYYGLAQAFTNDSERTSEMLARALKINPRHVDSLLFQADNLIDREEYKQAEKLIAQVLEINAKHPRAWAYRAVMAHVAGDRSREESHRNEALAPWRTNPQVDHLIGLKLSQKYRFAEGAACQQRALEFDPRYRPAREQLCQDLLRLGNDEQGWQLAAQIAQEDQYNVVAYNLVTLHDELNKFRTIASEHFRIRMDEREAQVYGQRALRLLTRAKQKMTAKYGVELHGPVTVEIFPQQKDFAIRTFGLPGGEGFLGVCFGPVITVNSPASRGANAANWEAVLWHEFVHSITLAKTRNKMPRWLSEGISVYEERQENPAWGQSLTPQYRELILEDEKEASGGNGGATPVSKLSGAFLRPPSPMHLQFAYYQSSMVVEYVIERWGASALSRVLVDLANDVPINAALASHTESIEKLDDSFANWFKEKALALAPKVDWERPDVPPDSPSAVLARFNQEHPNNFRGLLAEGRALINERKFEQARAPLKRAAELYPEYGEDGGPYELLAKVCQELGDVKSERQMLEKHVSLNAEAIEPRLRLMEIAKTGGDWAAVQKFAEQMLAVNPLVPAPHRYLAQAAEATNDRTLAIESHRTLLLLDPLDRAEHHYRVAELLAAEKQYAAARQAAVMALEEAPRFRQAQRLLLEIVDTMERSGLPAAPYPAATTAPAAMSAAGPAPAPAAAPTTQEASP